MFRFAIFSARGVYPIQQNFLVSLPLFVFVDVMEEKIDQTSIARDFFANAVHNSITPRDETRERNFDERTIEQK